MDSLFTQKILLVGTGESQNDEIRKLPIWVLCSHTAKKASSLLHRLNIDLAVSKWELPDLSKGSFVKRLKSAKPEVPIIALIEEGNFQQEIEARSLGVCAVVNDDVDGAELREILEAMLAKEQNHLQKSRNKRL